MPLASPACEIAKSTGRVGACAECTSKMFYLFLLCFGFYSRHLRRSDFRGVDLRGQNGGPGVQPSTCRTPHTKFSDALSSSSRPTLAQVFILHGKCAGPLNRND